MLRWATMRSLVPVHFEAFLQGLVGRPVFWVSVVGVLFLGPLARGLLSARAITPPPVLGEVFAFDLRDDRGQRVSRESLRGHAFIADLLCVSCGADGAIASETMRKLQHRSRNLGDALWLLSFSPDADATALAEVRRLHPSSERWYLVSGAPPQLRALLPGGKGLLLVDARSRVRGVYPATGKSDLDAVLRDASLVLGAE